MERKNLLSARNIVKPKKAADREDGHETPKACLKVFNQVHRCL